MKPSLEERMQNKFNAVKIEKKVELLVDIDNCKLETIEFTDDIEINNYLNNKGKEILKMVANGSLFLGKIFTEVQEKLIGNDDTYSKWLEANGYNRMTALRHKRRYELYKCCKTEKGKTIASILSVRDIEKIYKFHKGEPITDLCLIFDDEENSVSDIKNYIKEIKLVEIDNQETIEFSNYGLQEKYNTIIKKLDNYEIKTIDEKKQKKLNKYLEMIEKLLK